MMDQALLWMAALGGIVWVGIFLSAKLSTGHVAQLRSNVAQEAFEARMRAEIERAFAEELEQPSLPTMSVTELMEGRRELDQQAEERAAMTEAMIKAARGALRDRIARAKAAT